MLKLTMKLKDMVFLFPHPKALLNSILSMIPFLTYFGSILKKYRCLKYVHFGIWKTPFGSIE